MSFRSRKLSIFLPSPNELLKARDNKVIKVMSTAKYDHGQILLRLGRKMNTASYDGMATGTAWRWRYGDKMETMMKTGMEAMTTATVQSGTSLNFPVIFYFTFKVHRFKVVWLGLARS